MSDVVTEALNGPYDYAMAVNAICGWTDGVAMLFEDEDVRFDIVPGIRIGDYQAFIVRAQWLDSCDELIEVRIKYPDPFPVSIYILWEGKPRFSERVDDQKEYRKALLSTLPELKPRLEGIRVLACR